MKVTGFSAQRKNANRINVMIDGSYRFSLDITQIGVLGIKVGAEFDENKLNSLIEESKFGKLYSRALEYSLMRPRSTKEIKQYLYRKTQPVRTKQGDVREGYSIELTDRVLTRLIERGYIDDEKFAQFWVENRQVTKGISRRKLIAELALKGIEPALINDIVLTGSRNEDEEIQKVIAKKAHRYSDPTKLMQYLARQGFAYDDIKRAVSRLDNN